MAPLERHEKVLVDPEFLDTIHGSLACTACHGGTDSAADMNAAHQGMQADPTFPDASAACGQCHKKETELNKTSLHYTLATYRAMIHQRATADPAKLAKLDLGMDNHCYSCHASCGECHISRPNFARGGFISGHKFNKTPSQTNQCTACHGSRVGNEFTGETGQGDVHYTKHNMTCMSCHGSHDLHGDGKTDHRDRYDVSGLSQCTDCHQLDDKVEQHAIHGDKLACHVCHSQSYANCYACHVGLDNKGLAYYKNETEKELFHIGRNPEVSQKRSFKWMVVRRVPVVRESFDFYQKNALENFDRLNNWKYASPHNIQRKTTQNRACNNCHGNQALFLTEDKVVVGLRKANAKVVVPKPMIPGKQNTGEAPKQKKTRRSYF